MAFLGTLSTGSIILFSTFMLFCLYNGFWPSIQWTRVTNPSITASDLAGVYPIACHSHNDYWRPQPLATALLNGCVSIEADVWLREGQVLVGHTAGSLESNRNFSSLYIEPLLRLLAEKNVYIRDNVPDSEVVGGVFDSDPLKSLILVLDFKEDAPSLWDHVYHELEPLRERRLLTNFDGTTVRQSGVTIVVSGDALLSKVATQVPNRDMFFDAPLNVFTSALSESQDIPDEVSTNPTSQDNLGHGTTIASPSNPTVYSQANSYYASGNFKKIVGHVWHSKLSLEQLELIRAQIRGAHSRGLKVRYWGVPSWPLGIRNYLWRVLIREGVDVLSVEDVHAVAHDNWGPRKGGCMAGDQMLIGDDD